MNNSWTRPVILRKDVDKIKESVKIGDKFIYKTIYKDVDDGTVRPKIERVAVVKKISSHSTGSKCKKTGTP